MNPRAGEGRHVGGIFAPWGEQTVTEREAVELFRTFKPEELAVVISEEIILKPVVVEPGDLVHRAGYKRDHTHGLDSYVQSRQEDKAKQKAPYEIEEHIKQGRGDVYNLYVILNHIVSRFADVTVSRYPERFAQFINQQILDQENKRRMVSEIGAAQNLNAMYLGFLTAFIPSTGRGSRSSWPGLRPDQVGQIVEHTPDTVTNTHSPGERLDRFISMLTLTHEDAVRLMCAHQGVAYESLAELKVNDRSRFAAIHVAAGQYLCHNSFVGVLHDAAQEGNGSVYEFRNRGNPADRSGGNTERRSCAAYAFHDALVQGIGLALKANRETILAMISNPLMQINDHQREVYRSSMTTIDAINNSRGMYKTPEAKLRGQQWVLGQIADEMRTGSSNPQYLNILRVAREEAMAITAS